MTDLPVPKRPTYPLPRGKVDDQYISDLIRALHDRDREVNNALLIAEMTGTFAIDSTGTKTITINYNFGFIPSGVEHCQISVVEETNVDDWAYDLLKVDSISATQVVAKVNVSTASSTGGATARVVIWVRP